MNRDEKMLGVSTGCVSARLMTGLIKMIESEIEKEYK